MLLNRKCILIHPKLVSSLGTRLQRILGSDSEKTGKRAGKEMSLVVGTQGKFSKGNRKLIAYSSMSPIFGGQTQFAPISQYFPHPNLEAFDPNTDSGYGSHWGIGILAFH